MNIGGIDMKIQMSKLCTGTCTYQTLKRKGYNHFIRVANKNIAIKCKKDIPPVIVIQESVKIPAWKQVLNFQMTGELKTARQENSNYRVIRLEQPERFRFYVYDVIG